MSTRQCYIVTYDICDPKRLRKVFETMRGWGDHVQLSVFRCSLNRMELVQAQTELREIIKHDEDQVLFVDVGPEDGRAREAMSSLGRPYTRAERHAIIV